MLYERLLISLVEDGQWEIDTDGRIWRHWIRTGRKGGGSHLVRCERRRVERRVPLGYLQVRASLDGRRLYTGAHRLVWQHFNGDIPPGHEINHDNGLKDDNRPTNLVCCTAGENLRHAHGNGLIDQFGEKNPSSKLTNSDVAQIRLAYARGGYTQAELADRFGVKHQHVSRIVRGQRRAKQCGHVFESDLRHAVGERDSATGRFLGKKAAGRLLDGRTWDEFPEVRP